MNSVVVLGLYFDVGCFLGKAGVVFVRGLLV